MPRRQARVGQACRLSEHGHFALGKRIAGRLEFLSGADVRVPAAIALADRRDQLPGRGPASAGGYGVDAAFMLLLLHEGGIHAF